MLQTLCKDMGEHVQMKGEKKHFKIQNVKWLIHVSFVVDYIYKM